MTDTKKERKYESGVEKTVRLLVNIGAPAIALVATIFLYWVPQPCDMDKQYLYCRTHPGTIFDALGMILLWGAAIWLSGIPFYIIKDDDADPWSTVTVCAWIAGVAGSMLIYFL